MNARLEIKKDPKVLAIESKLKEHGVDKVVPDTATLAAAYRRSAEAEMIRQRIQKIARRAHRKAQNIKVPDDLEKLVRGKLKDSDRPWDAVVRELVAGRGNLEKVEAPASVPT